MDFLFELVQISICILDAYLIIDFFRTFFRLRPLLEKKYTEAGMICITALCVYMINSLDNVTVNMISTFVIYLSIIVIFFQGKLFKKFFYYITSMIIILGSEFLFTILLSLQTDFSPTEIEFSQAKVGMTALSVKLLELVLFSIVKRVMERSGERRVGLEITLSYSIMPISLIGIMVAITRFNIDFSALKYPQVLLLVSCILALIGNVVIFYVFDRYAGSIWRLRQQELMITRLEMEEKHYAQIERVNQEHAAFLHDVRHYMKTIGEMAAEHHDEAVLGILSELQIKVTDTEAVMFCPNSLLNAILNEKKKDAEKQKIQFKIVVEPTFSIDQVSDADLITILGNLLDNAMEAAGKCREGFIRLYLFTQNENHFSVIKVVNNYVGKIDSEENRLLTGKADKIRHGFGVQNVSAAAQKYDGYLQYFYQNGEFTSIVILPGNG
ncbi:MAG: GHKL domain-containing protein [Muribaculaceae bacterium]|nr:GHKL domain-containing protein [Muribaculaceae bacterium]